MIEIPSYLNRSGLIQIPSYLAPKMATAKACNWCQNECMNCLACESCLACQSLCEKSVQCHECGSCQSCQCSTQSGECSGCEYYCQCSSQGGECNDCQDACEKTSNCQSSCEGCLSCMGCEGSSCMSGQTDPCKGGCQTYAEGCTDSNVCQNEAQNPVDKQVVVTNESPENGGSFTVTANGLTNPWNNTYYSSAVITNVDFGGIVSNITQYMRKITPPSGGSLKSFNMNVTSAGYGAFTIFVYAQAKNGTYYKFGSAVVNITNKKPDKWHWSSSVDTALRNNGYTTQLMYYEWNSFIDRVIDTVKYKNNDYTVSQDLQRQNNMYKLGYDAKYSTLLEAAKAYNSGEEMLATKFNTVRVSIGAMTSTGIGTQDTDYKILGSYYITLQEKLNSLL